jgi:hypothetical protein
MAVAYGSWMTAQSGAVLVPAQAGKIIRVLKLVMTTWVGVKYMVQSDPGPDPLNLTPPLLVGAGCSLVLRLGRGLALATQRGKALGVSTTFSGSAGEHSLTVWYELVT